MHKELNRSGFYYGFPILLATTKDQKGRDDTEHPQRHANAAWQILATRLLNLPLNLT
ncbi:hypothetical protein [Campylobacter concisus]|uniref:Uncharacterized protein n=1 Tax=Campylobacter concisus TaxID=199 RepID=A0A7S9RQA9_9BACT|nr:hypothetical protein [Campylobacter concisus]QPH95942.1 hypothetical protein CVT08_01230 [Campylobacter concisus]